MDVLKAVIVQCGNEEYAISIDSIISVERMEKINSIPDLPDYMLGLMKVRGSLVPILDFEKILYNNTTEDKENAHIVFVQTKKLAIGLLVIDAKEIVDIPNSMQTKSGLIAYSQTPYFKSIANLETRLITIVDPDILTQTLSEMDEIIEYIETQTINEEV